MAEEHKGKDVSRNTSPSTSSQGEGDMADNEAEAGPSTQPAEESTAPPPPKKKRTRTLTTPHQAAVLHALLAQVRIHDARMSHPFLARRFRSRASLPLPCGRK